MNFNQQLNYKLGNYLTSSEKKTHVYREEFIKILMTVSQ